MPTPFVARSRELELLRRRITDTAQGSGSVVLISGEAGIGKTRLWQEAVAGLALPVDVVVGRAYPEERAIAFGPVADAIRDARRRAPSVLWTAVRARANVLAAVVPELALEVSLRPGPLDAPVVFETLLDAAVEASDTTGAIWVVEDLHWADDATWRFVAYAAARVGRLPLVLAATYRDEEVPLSHPRWSRIATLRREPDVTSLPLGRLNTTETREMLAVVSPGLPDERVEDIVRRSAGTPLVVEELALADVAARGGADHVPDIVRATVRDRVRCLDESAIQLGQLLAVIGREVELRLLRDLRPTQITSGLDALVEMALVMVFTRDGDQTVSFRHPLFLEAVYEDVPWAKRWQLHDEIAAMLEANPDGHAPERAARHRELAGRPDSALSILLRAAGESRSNGQVGRAASLGVSALELASRHAALVPQRDAIASTLMSDLFRSGRWTDLGPLVEEQWTRRESLDQAGRATLANVRSLHLFYIGEIEDARSVVTDEVAKVELVQGPAGALLASTAAFISWFCGDIRAAVDRGREALQLAERSADPEAICRARNVDVVARWRAERNRQAAIEGHRANAAFAREARLPVGEANARWSLALLTMRLEDLIAAETAAERAGTWYATTARLVQGFVHILEGHPDKAEARFARARTEVCGGIPMMADPMNTAEAHLHLHRGDLASARRALSAPSARNTAALPSWAAARSGAEGWLAWEEGRWDEAARWLNRSTELALRCSYHVVEMGPILLPLQVDSLLELGRREEAEALTDRAEIGQDPDRFFESALAAARFRLRLDDAAAVSAIERAATSGWPWLKALVGTWQGRWNGDAVAASAARETFAALGAARGVERADAVLRSLGARRRSPGPVRGAPLSRREDEVAELVAEGLTNVEIGRRLFLSRPTVATHVAHILTKLGFESRAQIAAWVGQRRSGASS